MTTIPNVSPGDLITADLMNQLIAKLSDLDAKVQQLGGGIGGGSVTVPVVVGMALATARSTIIAPAAQLNLGFVIDAFGNSVDVASSSVSNLIVLNEVPPAGTKVPPGTAVNLVVAATGSGGGGGQPQPPIISGFKPLKAPINQEVEIDGQSFALSRFLNTVTFNDVPAQPPSSASTTTSLFVVVPPGIPGAPVNAGQELIVVVKIVTPDGQTTANLTIIPPLAGSNPKVTTASPPLLSTGRPVTLTGENFLTPFDKNVVKFSTQTSPVVNAVPTAGSATQLTVTVPTTIVGLTAPGATGSVNIVVHTDRDSVALSAPIQVPSS